MDAGKKIILLFALFSIITSLLSLTGIISVSHSRWSYFLYHAEWLHLLTNMVCVAAIVRSQFRIHVLFPIFALLFAITAPMQGTPTVGSSGFCYALLGMMSWQSSDKKVYHGFISFFIMLGFMFHGNVNADLHLYCYVEGILLGLICKR